MTENKKRYVYHQSRDFGSLIEDTKDNKCLHFMSQATEELNALHEENEQLKQQNKELKQDNDIKFWKLQLMEQWNNTALISHELYLAIENGYEISDKFKKHLDDLKKKHEEHMKKAERLGI